MELQRREEGGDEVTLGMAAADVAGTGETLDRDRAVGRGPVEGPLSRGSLSSTSSADICLGFPARDPLGPWAKGLVCATSVPNGHAAFAARLLTWKAPGLTSIDLVPRTDGSGDNSMGLVFSLCV